MTLSLTFPGSDNGSDSGCDDAEQTSDPIHESCLHSYPMLLLFYKANLTHFLSINVKRAGLALNKSPVP